MKDPIIIALSGKKGSGKNTVSSFIKSVFDEFAEDNFDKLNVHSMASAISEARLEVAFADLLKQFCIDVLDLDRNQCYGSDEEKNTSTKYKWENTPHFLHSGATFPRKETFTQRGFMTGREVMQIFGTECVRRWFGNVWAEATLRKIQASGKDLVVITDARFTNEVDAILGQQKGHVIRLTRSPFQDSHGSETALDDFDWNHPRCSVIDNNQMTISETNRVIKPIITDIFKRELS